MGLENLLSGTALSPPRILTYGPPGVGKTTFAAGAGEGVVCIATEEGADVVGMNRFPLAESVGDVMSALDQLINEKHEFSVVCIDSLDWFETLTWDQACADAGVKSVEEIGVVMAKAIWPRLLITVPYWARSRSCAKRKIWPASCWRILK